MRNDPSRPQGPAWRQQPGAGRRNPKAQQDWRQEAAAAPSGGRVWSRRTKMWVGIGTLAGLVAVTVVVIFLLRPASPSTWVLLGTHDWDNLDLPLNVEGYNGLVKFADWAHSDTPSVVWGRNLPHILHDGPVELKKGTDWFAEVNEDRKKETTVVLYFSAPGGADADGPFLFLGDARPDDERKGRLYVADILSRLEDLKEKNKVLILDATQNGANWPFGQMHNDFTRRLMELDGRIEQIPRLIVINSSGPDQRSWPSDAVRQTFFAYYLREGMRGEAAAGESVVRAGKLFDFVREHVAKKVRANRLAEQTPILLPQKGGPERAQEIILTRVTGKPYQPSDALPNLDAAAIQKRWARCAELSRQSPPPYVNHPQLWRQYRDLCLRYEQLLRAGEDKAAAALEVKFTSLEARLNAAVPEHAACLENSLAMPAALGLALPRGLDEKVVQGWRRLWRADTAEERQDRWKELRGLVQGDVAEKVLRLRCGALLLDELAGTADEPARTRAAAVLDLITADAGPRPAELHFLYMLLKNLHGEPEARALQLVCRARREAEEAALALPPASAAGSPAYSERVFPWIRDKILKADEARRQGEDLLFSSVKEQRQQAETHLNEALDLYQKARAEGREVAQALAWRDRLFAVLPDFSHWLAGRFIDPRVPAAKEIEEETNKVQDLWVRAHRLESLLAKPDPQAVAELTKVSKEVSDKFGSLARDFNHRWRSLLDKSITQPRWHEVEEILAASWADPDLLPDQEPNQRKVLVESQRSVSEALLAKSDSPDLSVTAVKPDLRLAASHQARVAVDALGERWVDQNRHGADPNYALLRQRVSSPDPARWQADLALPADQVGRLWRQLPKEIKKDTDAARAPEAGVEAAGKALADADGLCRLLDGPAVDRLTGDPAADARRLQWHDLLIALGRRTAGDQWYGPDPQTPYYRLIGNKYQQEAVTLLKALAGRGGPSKALLAAATALQEELNKDSKLELTPARPGQENITSESQFGLDFRLAAGQGLKPGFVVLGLKAGKAFNPVFERDARDMQARKIDPAAGALDLRYVLNRSAAEADDEGRDREIVVEGFYRGQKPRGVITGRIYAPDTVITFTPRPKEASLAVLSDPAVEEQFAPKNSVLTIVLDCSGSMWAGLNPAPNFGDDVANVEKAAKDWKANQWGTQKRRFDHAVDSLEQVLRSLKKDVTVNLWTFAQLEGEGKIRKLWGPQKWDPAKLGGLMDRVRDLVPCYETPLAKAMYEAKADFDPKSEGFKTLVVLTDGMDNRFHPANLKPGEKDECAQLRRDFGTDDIPTFLEKAFKQTGIHIHMALFKVEKKELEEAKRQFSGIGKAVTADKVVLLPGEVRVIDEPEELVKDLRRAMRFELRYQLLRAGEAPVNETGFPVIYSGKDRQNLFWPRLDPAFYTIRVNNKYPQDVQLNDGDLVIATLRRQGKDVFLDRGLYARDLVNHELGNVDNNETKKASDWWLSLLRHEKADNVLRLMMGLEKEPPGAAAIGRHVIQQVRPRFVWFEVRGEGVAGPKLYWNNFERFPAPAWALEVRDWANPEGVTPKPVASAWWADGWDPATFALLDTLHRNPKVAVNQDFTTQKGKGYRIKRVVVEDHFINDEEGTKPCLVVRAEYDPKNQILIRLKNMPGVTDQAQHCYYSKAHEYTAYFWPVPEAALDREFDLEVISVDEFKQKAQERNTWVKDWNLPALGNAAPLPITLKPQREFDD